MMQKYCKFIQKHLLRLIGIICLWLIPQAGYPEDDSHIEKSPRLLILILASDQSPTYRELQNVWRTYMHSNPTQIKAYFLKGDPELSSTIEIRDDTIWSKTQEGLIQESAGIINKTILSLEALLPRCQEFDYVLRTNLSSFYIFPRLLEFLKTLPKQGCYAGSPLWPKSQMASGSGFILSMDLVQMLVKEKGQFLGNRSVEDDLLIGRFFHQQHIPLHAHERMDFLNLHDWNQSKEKIPSHIFQIRIKTPEQNRLIHDSYIQYKLLHQFYGK